MGSGTLCIDDGVIGHTYFPKPRAKEYLENFKIDEEYHLLSFFEVGRDEDINPVYSPVARSFLDIEDKIERALAMEAYFNPFKGSTSIEIPIVSSTSAGQVTGGVYASNDWRTYGELCDLEFYASYRDLTFQLLFYLA
ncbi:hypothetical protein Tco_0780782 [Tanacetum coccineum]